MDGSVRIMLEPTKQKVNLGPIEYRVFKGKAKVGEKMIEIEMLGLFRINDPIGKQEFERAVCAIRIDDPPPITLLSDNGLISP